MYVYACGRAYAFHPCGRCAVGSQAFSNANTFNANIGAWNTARVTTLSSVFVFSAVARNAARVVRSVGL